MHVRAAALGREERQNLRVAKKLTVNEKVRRLVYGLKKRGASEAQQKAARRKILHILENTERMCWYCREEMDIQDISLDHGEPISRGGTHKKENLVLCHKKCNLAKGDLTENEFHGLVGLLAELGEEAYNSVMKRLRMAGHLYRRN